MAVRRAHGRTDGRAGLPDEAWRSAQAGQDQPAGQAEQDGGSAGAVGAGAGPASRGLERVGWGAQEQRCGPAQVVEDAGDGVGRGDDRKPAQPASSAGEKTVSLPTNTLVGGVPTRPSRQTTRVSASQQSWWNSPPRSCSPPGTGSVELGVDAAAVRVDQLGQVSM
jgi:hypothetical protein